MMCGRKERLALMVGMALGALASQGPPARADLYMSSGNNVFRFDDQTGALINSASVDPTAGLGQGLGIGPDGKLYTGVSNGVSKVVSFNLDLSNRNTFITDGLGGLALPQDLVFDKNGDVYVASQNSSSVDRFHGPTNPTPGTSFPSAGHSGAVFSAVTSPIGLGFTPDGTLYASLQRGTGEIDRIDATGVATAVATGLGSISVGDIAINAAGTKLFVRDAATILRFTINGDHSLTQDSFTLSFSQGTALDSKVGLAFGTGGFLYATERLVNNTPGLPAASNTDWVVKIDPVTGTVSRFVTAGINSFNASNPTFLVFTSAVPEPSSVVMLAGGVVAMLGCARLRRRASKAR